MSIDNLTDLETMALTMYGEARGESAEGQIAVANVIMNRSVTRNKTVKEICLQPYQFSCWNKNDPNRKILEELGERMIHGSISDTRLMQCLFLAQGVIESKLLDNTHMAHHYMTTSLFYSKNRPGWAANPSNNAKTIGNHIFFNV